MGDNPPESIEEEQEHIMRYLVLIVGLLFMVFGLFGHCPQASAAQPSDVFLGAWEGALDLAGVKLEFTITFSRDEGAPISGTIDIPAQGAAGIRLGNIKVEGSKISFTIDDPGAQGTPTFEGELNDTKKKIAGTFSQSGFTGAFSMEKKIPTAD